MARKNSRRNPVRDSGHTPAMTLIEPAAYHYAAKKLREFFEGRGFVEVHTQSRLSILAACEDPRTIGTFTYAGEVWPLPQTGQMWLEYELLTKSDVPGYFCMSTSFREEPRPIPGRHDMIFPMFEFETHGGIKELEKLERELLEFLGFGDRRRYPAMDYDRVAKKYKTIEIEHEHEKRIEKDFGPVFFLKNFPQYTSPFWNMKKVGTHACKIDVLLYGMETIGSAERSTKPDEMYQLFHSISDGMYAEILHGRFKRERVEQELEKFLTFKFFPRCGGGIGMTRMIRALSHLS